MKKIFFSLLMAFAIFFVSVDNADAQCPTGYTPTTRVVVIGGCHYTINFCYKCSILGLTDNWVSNFKEPIPVDPNCISTMTKYQIYQAAYNIMKSGAFLNSLCGSEDCVTGQKKKYNFIVPMCLKKVRTNFPVGSNHFPERILDCDPYTYCVEEYEVCLDYTKDPPELVTTLVNKTSFGSFTCDLPEQPFPEPGLESDCFKSFSEYNK